MSGAMPQWAWAALTILGLAAVTAISRNVFLWSRRELRFPEPLQRALQMAPLAAIVAITAPEIFLSQGHLIETWRDARIFGALAGLAFYAWRRSLFGTIACGTGVMLALRFGMGW